MYLMYNTNRCFYKEILLILLLLFEVSFGNTENRIYSSFREDSLTEKCAGNRKLH